MTNEQTMALAVALYIQIARTNSTGFIQRPI